jgi:hypothetical protein
MRNARFIFLFLMSLVNVSLYAQFTQYPVMVNTQVIPPFTPYAPSYYSGVQPKLRCSITNQDYQHGALDVFVRMKISSNSFTFFTPDYIGIVRATLDPGVPYQLSPDEIAKFFRSENFDCSFKGDFLRSQQFPDGYYNFHFEMYDVKTNRLLSSPSMGRAPVYIRIGEPPRLNFPENNKIITEMLIPNILFTWQQVTNLPANYTIEYEFTIVQLFDKNINPESAFDYSLPLYTEVVKNNALMHDATKPMLIPGYRYAWRVRAIAKEGISLDETPVIKNKGYSQVFWFDYAVDCKQVATSGMLCESNTAIITWNDVYATETVVEYRKKGSSTWNEKQVTEPEKCVIPNLPFGKEYEYRIGTRCAMNDVFQYSGIKGFRVPEKLDKASNPKCGMMPNSKITNKTAIAQLIPGLPVLAGDFPVFITKVTGSKTFSGEGYVGIPFLNGFQVAVTFNNITVNTDHQLIGGYFETKYDAKNNMLFDVDEALNGGKNVGDIRTGEEKAAFKVNYSINPNAKVLPVKPDGTKDEIIEGQNYTWTKGENGNYTFVIQATDGQEHTVETDTIPTTIEDQDGNTFSINEDGTITPLSGKTDIVLDDKTKNTPRPDIAKLQFATTLGTKYALDDYQDVYAQVTEYFVKYKPTTEDMIASAKFMLPGASDEIFVQVAESTDKFHPDQVHFVTDKGKEYQGKYNAEQQGWTLNLLGSEANDGQNLYVVQEENGQYATLAKLSIYSYEPKTLKVKLVPVNDFANDFAVHEVSEQLNAIYNKVGITAEVTFAENFDYEPLKNAPLNVSGSGLFATETKDMQALQFAYRQEQEPDDAVTLFIIENVTGADGVQGDMPRGKQFGYLFPHSTSQTIAHEIGHGIFHLDHPFNRANGAKSFGENDLKDNLMQYYNGTNLTKFQWDAIHSPGRVIGIFEMDEDGMLASTGGMSWLGNIFFGLLPDTQEKEIEKTQLLFDHVHKNYTVYFDNSKTKNLKIGQSQYPQWSVRSFSHQNKVAKSLYDKLTQDESPVFGLHPNGIFVEKCKLDDQDYKLAIYSFDETVALKSKDIKLSSYTDLRDNKAIKAGYTNQYGFLVFFDKDTKKPLLLIQIIGKNPQEDAKKWLNYLSIVTKTETQMKKDELISLKWDFSFLWKKEELPKVWGNDQNENSISVNIEWVSQFDESKFEKCVGCWKINSQNPQKVHNTCCRRATEYMMGNVQMANCKDSSIANNAPYMQTFGSIVLGYFIDNTTKYNKELYNSTAVNYRNENLTMGIEYIKNKLKAGRPIIIGVHYTNGGTPPNNANRATRHFMVVVGYGKEKGGKEYFRFYDPGRTQANRSSATSLNNKLFIDYNVGSMQGIYKNETFTLTEIVKTN